MSYTYFWYTVGCILVIARTCVALIPVRMYSFITTERPLALHASNTFFRGSYCYFLKHRFVLQLLELCVNGMIQYVFFCVYYKSILEFGGNCWEWL